MKPAHTERALCETREYVAILVCRRMYRDFAIEKLDVLQVVQIGRIDKFDEVKTVLLKEHRLRKAALRNSSRTHHDAHGAAPVGKNPIIDPGSRVVANFNIVDLRNGHA